MTAFNIQELVEHVETTQQEIRGKWYPVRPLQLTGLDGLKLRIKGAIQVLLGKADTVEWSLRPIKDKVKKTDPVPVSIMLVDNTPVSIPNHLDFSTLKITGMKVLGPQGPMYTEEYNDTTPWEHVIFPDTHFWQKELRTKRGSITITFSTDAPIPYLIMRSTFVVEAYVEFHGK